MLSNREILETIRMVQEENLDIRTITMGISLRDCGHEDIKETRRRIYAKITSRAARLVEVGEEPEREYGIPIVNKRISVTPIALVGEACQADDYTELALALDEAHLRIAGFCVCVYVASSNRRRASRASLRFALAHTRCRTTDKQKAKGVRPS